MYSMQAWTKYLQSVVHQRHEELNSVISSNREIFPRVIFPHSDMITSTNQPVISDNVEEIKQYHDCLYINLYQRYMQLFSRWFIQKLHIYLTIWVDQREKYIKRCERYKERKLYQKN